MRLSNGQRKRAVAVLLTLALLSLIVFAQDKNNIANRAGFKQECSAALHGNTELLNALGNPKAAENGLPLTWRFAIPVHPDVLLCVKSTKFTVVFKFSGRNGAPVTGFVARPRTLLTSQQTWYTAPQENGSQWVYAVLQARRNWATTPQPPQIVIDAECDNCNATDTWLTYDFQTSESNVKSRKLFAAFQQRSLVETIPPMLTTNQSSTQTAMASHWQFTTTAQNMCGTFFDGAIKFAVSGKNGDEKFSWWLPSKEQLYEAEVAAAYERRIVRWSPKYTWDLCAVPQAEIVLRMECRACSVSEPTVIRPRRPELPSGASPRIVAYLSSHWTHNHSRCTLQPDERELAPIVSGDIARLWLHEGATSNSVESYYRNEQHVHNWAAYRKLVAEWQAALTKDPTSLNQIYGPDFRMVCSALKGQFYRLVDYGENNAFINNLDDWGYSDSFETADAPRTVEEEDKNSVTRQDWNHIENPGAFKKQCREYRNGTTQSLIALSLKHKSDTRSHPTWRFFTLLPREVLACVEGTKFIVVFKFSSEDGAAITKFEARPRSLLTSSSTWYTEPQKDGSQWVYASLQIPRNWEKSPESPEIVIDVECDNCGKHKASVTYDLERLEYSVKTRELYDAFENRLISEGEPLVLSNTHSSTNTTTAKHWQFMTTARNLCTGPFDGAIRFVVNGTHNHELFFWKLPSSSKVYEAEVGARDDVRIVRWNPKYTLVFCEKPETEILLMMLCEDCGVDKPMVIRPTSPEVPNGASLTDITFIGFWDSSDACRLQFTQKVPVPVVGDMPRMWFTSSADQRADFESSNISTHSSYSDWVTQRTLLSNWQTDLAKKCNADERRNWRGTVSQCNMIRGVLYHLVDWAEKTVSTSNGGSDGEDVPNKC